MKKGANMNRIATLVIARVFVFPAFGQQNPQPTSPAIANSQPCPPVKPVKPGRFQLSKSLQDKWNKKREEFRSKTGVDIGNAPNPDDAAKALPTPCPAPTPAPLSPAPSK